MKVSPSDGLFVATGRGATALTVAFVAAGAAAKIVTVGRLGGVRSLVQECVAGVGSVLPAPSTARTLNVCDPDPGTSTGSGDVHAVKALWRNEHWKVEPASLEVNENTATSLPVRLPGLASVVSGGVVSTVHVIGWAWVSTLPAGSTAWMSRERVASESPV